MTTTANLSWLSAGGYVSDGGLETDLIFNRGVDLPEFASFPLVEDDARPRAAARLLRRLRRRRPQGRRRASPWSRRPGAPTPTGAPGSGTTPPRSTA